MKRKIRNVIYILASLLIVGATPSCRSSNKAAKGNYKSQFEQLANNVGGRHKHEESDSHDGFGMKLRKKIVDEAMTWKGTPYGYGRADKGVASDCSGMVMSVYEKVTGVKLPRNSAKQSEFCHGIRKKDVKIGDLVFFATGSDPDRISHVGIMIDDRNFIHASTSKGVVVSDATQPYYVRTFKGYGRVPY